MGTYDVAQVCERGHLVTDSAASQPQHRQKFCGKCGSATIISCPECSASIRGDYDVPGFISFTSHYSVPSFCHECGAPYPWTAARLHAAEELLDMVDHLTAEERATLKADLPALGIEGPRTQVAIVRIRSLLAKVRAELTPALRSALTSIATDAVKKSLGL